MKLKSTPLGACGSGPLPYFGYSPFVVPLLCFTLLRFSYPLPCFLLTSRRISCRDCRATRIFSPFGSLIVIVRIAVLHTRPSMHQCQKLRVSVGLLREISLSVSCNLCYFQARRSHFLIGVVVRCVRVCVYGCIRNAQRGNRAALWIFQQLACRFLRIMHNRGIDTKDTPLVTLEDNAGWLQNSVRRLLREAHSITTHIARE